MKRLLFFFCWMLFVGTACAQRLQVVINYENGIYNGYPYEKFKTVELDFIKDKPRYEGRFMESLSEYYIGMAYLTDSVNADEQVIYLDILKVSSKGKVVCDVTFNDDKIRFEGRGGTFGTFLNLMGDGFESLGKNIAWYLNDVANHRKRR